MLESGAMGGWMRRAGVGWALLWLALTAGLASAGFASTGGPPAFDRVVLVSLDTLRADHLPFYGYPRETAPFLSELAREGVVFERAYAPMPTTAPSHATLFTSLYPVQHGLLSNSHRLPDGIATLPERLAAAGFTTVGASGTHAHWGPTGLDRGFARFAPRARESGEVYRRADGTVEAALAALDAASPGERLFLFVHLFDAHAPLRPPPRHLTPFQSEGPEARARHARFLVEQHGIPLAFYKDDPGRLLFIADRYDAEIRFADEQLRRLHDALAARGLAEGTLWVVTADHGEGLGNHRFMGHGKAYEEGLRVPLFFHADGGGLAPRRVAEIVEHVDLAPTLLELLGQAPPERREGRSLVPLLRGGALAESRAAFSQRGRIASGEHVRRLPQEDPGDLSGDQYAWIESRWKYLHHVTGDDELYDLEADPHESRNLLADETDEAKRLLDLLTGRLRRLSQDAPASIVPELDEATREELRALGYAP